MRTVTRCVLFTIIALAACITVPPAASAQTHYESLTWGPGDDSLLVGLGGDLYVVPVGDGGSRPLIDSEGRDVYGTLSPDGTAVAFASDRDGDSEIFVAGADGSGARALTDNDARDSYPDWSPDGRTIAFMRKDGEHWQLWLMAADGSNARPLTRTAGNDYNPRWSPDGAWIVFESDRHGGGQDEIYVIRPDGSDERRVTETGGNDIHPAWSPNGERLAYCTIAEGRATVHVQRATDGAARAIVEDACLPVWSSGGRLAYVHVKAGEAEELHVAAADGSDAVAVAGPMGR